jgi:hypothetical protein
MINCHFTFQNLHNKTKGSTKIKSGLLLGWSRRSAKTPVRTFGKSAVTPPRLNGGQYMFAVSKGSLAGKLRIPHPALMNAKITNAAFSIPGSKRNMERI